MCVSRTVAVGLAGVPAAACRRVQPVRMPARTALLAATAAARHGSRAMRPTASASAAAAAAAIPRRYFSMTAPRRHGHVEPPKPGEE